MDGYKLNKFAGAVLFALLIIMGIREINNALNSPDEPEQTVYAIAGVEEADSSQPAGGGAAPAQAAPTGPSLAELLATADIEAGQKVFRKCVQCHTIDAGGRNLQGPNLHNIMGAPKAGKEGYRYSTGLAEKGGTWTYEEMDAWLTKPNAFVTRPKMILQLKKAEDRANVIAFLAANTDNPPPFPEVEAAPEPEEPAPAPQADPAPEADPAQGGDTPAPAPEAPSEATPAS